MGLGTILETKQEEQSIVRKTWVVSSVEELSAFNGLVEGSFPSQPTKVPSHNWLLEKIANLSRGNSCVGSSPTGTAINF